MIRFSIASLAFAALCGACRPSATAGSSSQILAANGSAPNLFVCDVALPSKSECHLREGGAVVVPLSGIFADIEIHYEFGCPTGNRESSIVLYQEGGPAQELKLDTVANLVFSTDQAVKIRDDNETWTRSRRFNPSADCSLNLTYNLVPAGVQVSRWAERSAALVELMGTTSELYDLKKEVQYWYEKFVSSPDLIGGLLRERAAELLASPKLRDQQLGASLKAIADNAPHAMIMEPYATYRVKLEAYRDETKSLIGRMETWRQTVIDALRHSLDATEASLSS